MEDRGKHNIQFDCNNENRKIGRKHSVAIRDVTVRLQISEVEKYEHDGGRVISRDRV